MQPVVAIVDSKHNVTVLNYISWPVNKLLGVNSTKTDTDAKLYLCVTANPFYNSHFFIHLF